MLPGELVEKFVGGPGAIGLYILVALVDSFDGFLVVLAFPFEIIGQGIIEGLSSALPPSTGEFLELGQPFGFYWQRSHIAPYRASSNGLPLPPFCLGQYPMSSEARRP